MQYCRAELDYCNSLPCGSPASTLDKLQQLQNRLVRIVTKSHWWADAVPILWKPHWLPIRQMIEFIDAGRTYKVRTRAAPRCNRTILTASRYRRRRLVHSCREQQQRPPSAPSPRWLRTCGTHCQTRCASEKAFHCLSIDFAHKFLRLLLPNLPVHQQLL